MKKIIFIPVSICLLCIALSAYYVHSKYMMQTDIKKNILYSYASVIKEQVADIGKHLSYLPYVVQPIMDETGILSEKLDMHPESTLHLEQFYAINNDFINSISVYDRNGNVFNIFRDNRDSSFIKDTYKSRDINILRSEKVLLADKNSFSFVMPVFHEDALSGNVVVNLNMKAFPKKLFKTYYDREGIWLFPVLGHEVNSGYPSGDGLKLSRIEDMMQQIDEQKEGWLIGEITGDQYSATVLSYYSHIPVSGYSVGIVISDNLSPAIASSWAEFAAAGSLILAITGAVIFVLCRISIRRRVENEEKDRQLSVMKTLYDEAPVGIMVSRQRELVSLNRHALELLNRYVSPRDIGRDMGAINFPPAFYDADAGQDEWTLCSFGLDGQERLLGRKQVQVGIKNDKYTIDVFGDITQMEQGRKNAVRSEIAKSELLSRISKDVKKLMDGIEDAVVLLMQNDAGNPDILHIRDSAAALSEMMENMHDFADIEAGRVILDEMPFNVVDVLKQIIDSHTGEAQSKDISIHAHVASSVVRHVVGDAHRFGQILDQLLSNAVKFTASGEIRISLETTQPLHGKILIKCSVEDTGPGMSKKQLKNLFSIDLRAKDKKGTIGLGIVVAKQLIAIMGGTIRATSPSPLSTQPGAPGVQFQFTVQCLADRQADKRLNLDSIASCRQIGVLIIISDAHSVQYLSNPLIRKGIKPDIFTYNKESAELLVNKLIIDKGRYHIVIIAANDTDSFSIAEEIHKADLTRDSLFVLIDSCSIQGSYLKAKELGMDYYFRKSDNLSDFDSILKTHFINLPAEEKPQMENIREGLRILVAENNALSQSVAKMVFKKLGCQVDFACNALDLISKLNNNTYDIIFLDLKFPPSDGFDIVGILREKGYKLPVIAMTSALTKENIKNISDSGMNGYVPKPPDVENIKKILLKWFM
jgi:signal transduction histidine kinase/CheY-like chemotaxis protein